MSKRVAIIVILLLVLVLGIIAAVFLLRSSQEIREEASVPEGEASVSIAPATATVIPGTPTRVSILFNTGGISIAGVAVKMSYTYSEVQAPVDVRNITISSGLLGSGEWTCPVSQFNASAGTATVEISCFNTSTSGYSSSVDTPLATFDLMASGVPEINPVVLSFDPSQSIIASKITGEDVLLIPTSTGTYQVSGAGIDPGATGTPVGTATATPLGQTPAATATATATPFGQVGTSTPAPVLLDAGISGPTMMGIGAGIILLIGATLLAI